VVVNPEQGHPKYMVSLRFMGEPSRQIDRINVWDDAELKRFEGKPLRNGDLVSLRGNFLELWRRANRSKRGLRLSDLKDFKVIKRAEQESEQTQKR
jgi:hypothetical protein